jgi:hypothetical protein
MFDFNPFGCLCIIDMLTQDTTINIYITWLHKVNNFKRKFKLYCDISQLDNISTTIL